MLLIVEKGIRGRICHAIHRYAKANNKYMKEYGKVKKKKESSYLKYWDVNNLYGWAMLWKFTVNNFEWIKDTTKFYKDFIKSHNEENNEDFFLEVDVQYPEKLHEINNALPFLPERMKIEKFEKLVTNLHVNGEYVIHIRNLKQFYLKEWKLKNLKSLLLIYM